MRSAGFVLDQDVYVHTNLGEDSPAFLFLGFVVRLATLTRENHRTSKVEQRWNTK